MGFEISNSILGLSSLLDRSTTTAMWIEKKSIFLKGVSFAVASRWTRPCASPSIFLRRSISMMELSVFFSSCPCCFLHSWGRSKKRTFVITIFTRCAAQQNCDQCLEIHLHWRQNVNGSPIRGGESALSEIWTTDYIIDSTVPFTSFRSMQIVIQQWSSLSHCDQRIKVEAYFLLLYDISLSLSPVLCVGLFSLSLSPFVSSTVNSKLINIVLNKIRTTSFDVDLFNRG